MSRHSLWLRVLLITGILVPASCAKDQDDAPCGADDPAEELAWLKEAIGARSEDGYSYYAIATLNTRTVFYYGNCNPAINYASYLQTCAGDTLGFTSEFVELLSNPRVVWKPDDSVCDFEGLQ